MSSTSQVRRPTGPSKIVLPAGGSTPNSAAAATSTSTLNPASNFNPILIPIHFGPQEYAPAWFYSALNWLGRSYFDGSSVQQFFNSYLVGSDVDPYASLGSTRLFVIFLVRNNYYLNIATDVDSFASTTWSSSGSLYSTDDNGILALYKALAASSIWPSVNYVYVPGRIGSGLDPGTDGRNAGMPVGYDPLTGMRTCVAGSAVSQIVPLSDYLNTHNEQIYNTQPVIVPFVPVLVYNITTNNSLNAKTFVLPASYSPDLISTGNYYVNNYGVQTVLFPGGPGYNGGLGTALKLQSTTISSVGGFSLTTYTFDKATVVTSGVAPILSPAQLGVNALTYSGVPSSVFASQHIMGFYRSSTWSTACGVPLFDYAQNNVSFSSSNQSTTLADPVIIYNPTSPFLNGGSLPNVLRKLWQATYMYSSDRLQSILDSAAEHPASGTKDGAALAVMAGALEFQMNSATASPILDHLSVPVAVTVTTTPPLIIFPPTRIFERLSSNNTSQPIGTANNVPREVQLSPTTVQVGLVASIPGEALSGTGISSLETGTQFPAQPLGQGANLEKYGPAGAVLNIMEGNRDIPNVTPYNLTIKETGTSFTVGTYYVLSIIGSSLTCRGSDGSTVSSTLSQPATTGFTFVGAMIYSEIMTSILLFAKIPLTIPSPAVGTNSVLQGEQYNVRLTVAEEHCSYDIFDSTQAILNSNITVLNPTPPTGAHLRFGDLYFGSFLGGSSQMTVWNVPVFLTVGSSQLTGASFNGTMVLEAESSGVPSYQLQITDYSLFVFSNLNIDTQSIGSVSTNNVFLATAAINSSPDDLTSKAFAPCKLLIGLVRQAQMGTAFNYVFVPEDDSVVIGKVRYMLSIINLGDLPAPDSNLPYPPIQWPSSQYWQFANRHNPFIDVSYTGTTEAERISKAQSDTVRIGLGTATAQEPMHMYLDTDPHVMTTYPIFAFPYSASTRTVDQAKFQTITSTILSILQTEFPTKSAFSAGPLDVEQITLPDALQLNNPWTSASATTSNNTPITTDTVTVATTNSSGQATTPIIAGRQVTNLSPNTITPVLAKTIPELQALKGKQKQETAAAVQVKKTLGLTPNVTQAHISSTGSLLENFFRRPSYQPIYGFSVFNSGTGEAYIIQIVSTDMSPQNKLPNPTENVTYDPFYVRVVFLNTLICYNMSIIVPSMVYDAYNYLSYQGTTYQNDISKTDELNLGYMYSLYNSTNNFNSVSFNPYPPPLLRSFTQAKSQSYVYTNIPYSTEQSVLFSPIFLYQNFTQKTLITNQTASKELVTSPYLDISLIKFAPITNPPAYFACRRQNWRTDTHLMQATNPPGTSIYLGFGAGDIVPLRLDGGPPTVDTRQPAHMHELTSTFTNQAYLNARTVTVNNTPFVVSAAMNVTSTVSFISFSLNASAGAATVQMSLTAELQFPTQCYVIGQASTTLTTVPDGYTTSQYTDSINGSSIPAIFELVTYNNLVYLVRAISNVSWLGKVGGLGTLSGLLVDTFVPALNGTLQLAQAARYKRSGLSYFGNSYTPTTMVDSLDNLDYTDITGDYFYAPTIFIPIPELDCTKGIAVDLSSFLGQQIWTIIYPEIVAQPNTTVNGVPYPNGYNLDGNGKPILSLQKLHFVYDSQVVMYTPNDLAHKYPLQSKQAVLALTNDQIREGICWRSANLQPNFDPPTNICAQQILPTGIGMDRPNIIYSKKNRPVTTSSSSSYMGMSVNSFVSISATAYNIEESAMVNDATGTNLVSQVSSVSSMLIGVLFDYDNNDLGILSPYDPTQSTKGLVFLNGYLGSAGYVFSSPDHFDVNDIKPSQVPLLEQIATIFGQDVAYNNTDLSLPRQFWSLTRDSFTAPGLANYIADIPPSVIDPTFSNRTRSLLLTMENSVRPTQLGVMDTYNSVVSVNLLLENGITGAVFMSKKAERETASIGTTNPESIPISGLPSNIDFFVFSRDHYGTLQGATLYIIDQGYAMCLVDNGSGTGTKVAKYYTDSDGNYYELYSVVLSSPATGILETSTFTLKITLATPENLSATPITPATPNNVNPQDLVTQINTNSTLVYAAMGASTPGQSPPFLPIQSTNVPGKATASPITGPPGPNGYSINVVGTNHQPVQIQQIYSGTVTYPIAGPTTIQPISAKTGKAVPFYGSLSHGLDLQQPTGGLQSQVDPTVFLPRVTVPAGAQQGSIGGNGLGALIGSGFSLCFQGVGAIPPAVSTTTVVGTTMKADDTVFYSYNAVTSMIMDSTGKSGTATGGQYIIDNSDPANPIYVVMTAPKFTLNGVTYSVNVNTTASDGVTSQYTLVVGQRSFLFETDNIHVTVDRTKFTFNPLQPGGIYTVTYASLDNPSFSDAPSPITLTPFTLTAGGLLGGTPVDVFNSPGSLTDMVTGVIGRFYTYNPVQATVTVSGSGGLKYVASVTNGSVFASNSGYGYVVGYNSADNGYYTINGTPMIPYSANLTGTAASYALMTSPQMFTVGNNFYTFDKDPQGDYLSVTGNGQTYPINPYQFSINGVVYIINTQTQPNTVIGSGNTYTMTASNTQFILNGVQYTIVLKANSLLGATISGQFNITQGNVIVIENYVYQLDTINSQIIGNGTTYPLTTSGLTYTITTTNQSFTVTTEPNATTVTINNIVYEINNTTVVGDGVIFPILPYRTFTDGNNKFNVELDGTISVAPPLTLTGTPPGYTRATFTDAGTTYTVNDSAAFDGTTYFLIAGTVPQFAAAGLTYSLRTDGVAIAAGPSKTYIVNTSGPLMPNQFKFGTSQIIYYGRPSDVAAFDGTQYYAITNNQFTDSTTNLTYTISGNTAVNFGNSYEIYSNLGQGAYFAVPSGKTYYVNISVADTGNASGSIYNVFPISGSSFTIPLVYTITITGNTVSVSSTTFPSGPASSLTATGGKLTGGYFEDQVTQITYYCVVNGTTVTFIDSSNQVYPYPAPNSTNTFVAEVVVSTGVYLAVDSKATPQIYPILNNQFVVNATTTYQVNVPIAYSNANSGPYYPIINGRFIVPRTDPLSSITYTIRGATVVKGYVISNDDEFSTDGNVVYTINAVNVVKATNQTTLSGTAPTQTLVAGTSTYLLNTTTSLATTQSAGLTYNVTTKQFTVLYNGINSVTYTVGSTSVQDNRGSPPFPSTLSGTTVTFTDTVSGVTFTFDSSGNNPILAEFVYENNFFIDSITGTTYYVDVADRRVEDISYLPETTQYAFSPADGQTYLIHYSDVGVTFPVISNNYVNAGVATVGSDEMLLYIDDIYNVDNGSPISVNTNSFEINGNLYSITGHANGADYSACQVVGATMPPKTFSTSSKFYLTDPNVVYTIQLDSNFMPVAITANFAIRPSQDLLTINDDVYIITYNTITTGSLLGQGQPPIPITKSSFTLTNGFDSTKATFIFEDLNIYDAASVVGQFIVYLSPTFVIGSSTYTLNPVNLVVDDQNKRPFPLITNPTLFSINGFNYVIDSNRVPHTIIGNNNASPLSTDVTVQSGKSIPNSTFTLNGLVYMYVEDTLHNLLTITGTKSYMITQSAMTFKLDSSLIFTISTTAPAAGSYVGSVRPIGVITAGTTVTLNIYAGVPESGNADFFLYKNVMYTFIKSNGVYVSIQKSYTVYVASPAPNQQQLAVFDLGGTTYMVTNGTTAGTTPSSGINPGTIWAATSISSTAGETQYGLVYGFTAQPINVFLGSTPTSQNVFQFQNTDSTGISTLYDILYLPHASSNAVKVDTPDYLPSFAQSWLFGFATTAAPLTFETGGYNAFSTSVSELSPPVQTFSAAYTAPVASTDSTVDGLITAQGDFSVEFWHSIPFTNPPPSKYHPLTWNASQNESPVYFVDIDFEDPTDIYISINNTVMKSVSTPPVFSSRWRHLALTYTQPYVMMCNGGGFEVDQASNYNFARDFSIVLTFSVSDVQTNQGLLYKGTGSLITSPEMLMSYQVTVSGGYIQLSFTDGNSSSQSFQGPAITAGTFYRLIITKSTNTPAGPGNGLDPYAPPFNLTDLQPVAAAGVTAQTTGIGKTSGNDANGEISISQITPVAPTTSNSLTKFLNTLATTKTNSRSYSISMFVQVINDDGTYGTLSPDPANPSTVPQQVTVNNDAGLVVLNSGGANLLFGSFFDQYGTIHNLGSSNTTGNIRDVYLFSTAINPTGISSASGPVDIAAASSTDLAQAGLLGWWKAAYDANNVVSNAIDPNAVAVPTSATFAYLTPITGHEFEGTNLYLDGHKMPLTLYTDAVSLGLPGYVSGSSLLNFNAGPNNLSEISVWNMCRQQYQIMDDMFGRLQTPQASLALYMSGSFTAPANSEPLLPMKQYIDQIAVTNQGSLQPTFSLTFLTLTGCPAVGRCGPLITPNLYTPPGEALTVCNSVPILTTFSTTLNGTTSTLAGEINEAYIYVSNSVLTVYGGKKVGDLVLSWISQEQGDVQLIGFVEGAPPCPMANLTNKASYAGATSVTLTVPTSVSLKYVDSTDNSTEDLSKWIYKAGGKFDIGLVAAPMGGGVNEQKGAMFEGELEFGPTQSNTTTSDTTQQTTPSTKLDESNKYTVKMEGYQIPKTGDLFMSSINALTTPSVTAGTPASKTSILPNPGIGGFTTSNPAGPLPKTVPTEEKYGQSMYVPSPYGQAFVTSQTLDVYQQTLVQNGTVYGFVRVPNAQIPRDLNIVSFQMSSKYLRPGCLDGVIGYAYNPATLPNGTQTYTTSTGQMNVLYDKNFSPGDVGHDASYMRVVEAYQLKQEIDQEAFNALALYQTTYNNQADPSTLNLPGLDFYNEHVWSSRGGIQEVKHTYSTSYDEVYTTTSGSTSVNDIAFNTKITVGGVTVANFTYDSSETDKSTLKYSYNTTGTSSFDVAVSLDNIETDTQMRYASNNDAHFVMKNNSMYTPNNQSGLNLIISSDGLVYNLVPSVSSGAGLPQSDNIDDSTTYTQPQPAYSSGNASGPTGILQPYDRPGKTSNFRMYTFFLQPRSSNSDDFWGTVVDPVWLANSPSADAVAIRSAQRQTSVPWRLFYRVTYSERFPPPISGGIPITPQITPLIAVPVLNAPSAFLYNTSSTPIRGSLNLSNDVESNVVLCAPSSTGLGVGTVPTTGLLAGVTILPNNIIPFDLATKQTSITTWGDTPNTQLLKGLVTSALGLNKIQLLARAIPGSTKIADILDPVSGGILYSTYADPNGLNVAVAATNPGITVYQDVNSNPIQYFDGKVYHSLQADYIPSPDGTVMHYIQPPTNYDQTQFSLVGDYDLFGNPGDQWRYYLVSSFSSNMTANPSVSGTAPFFSSASGYTGFTVARSQQAPGFTTKQVPGYVLCQSVMQWPHLNTKSETSADVLVYKAMSLLDTFPIGDLGVLVSFLEAQYPGAPFMVNASGKNAVNEDIVNVFARNIFSYFNSAQAALVPQ